MDYLTEKDYSELIKYLINGLRNCHADDVIRQIESLETVNVIEEIPPAAAYAAKGSPDRNQTRLWENEIFEEKPPTFKPIIKVDKKLEREAVSEYSSRPMTSQEMYYASIDILETYLLSVPKILEGIQRSLHLDGLSNMIWKNESERYTDTAPVNIVEAVGHPNSEVQKKMEEMIKTLKNVPGKEKT